ncbi:MAG TPA: ATP-binding cassette domain-containing protein [Spirochaetota bacterium]|nr:ATP-binding cassette domain-containing protein [Spirochaetota bacterium]HRT74167.1 ATP-binding cassette domain-containing protein [Spirochaetota bacterium]
MKQEKGMVSVTSLAKYYTTRKAGLFERPGTIRAVDGVSFTIPVGQTMGMVGESGSGKTTAARSILRLIEPDAGEIVIGGTKVHELDRKELRDFRKNMQIVFQDPFSSLNPRMTVEKIITEPLRIHTAMKQAEINSRFEELAGLVGLEAAHRDRYPHEFSGGQRQRIGIARALALNPRFIILDEPVSALDMSIQGQILNLLSDLQRKLKLTYLFVSHDLAVVEHMSDRIVVMYLGRIVEESSKKSLYANPLHPYTQSLMKAIPETRASRHGFSVIAGEIPSPESPPRGCHFHPRCPCAMDICGKEYPPVKTVRKARVACHLY